MTPEEHHDIMKQSLDDHLAKMPKNAEALILSFDRETKNASVVSSMDDMTTAMLLKSTLDEHIAKVMGN